MHAGLSFATLSVLGLLAVDGCNAEPRHRTGRRARYHSRTRYDGSLAPTSTGELPATVPASSILPTITGSEAAVTGQPPVPSSPSSASLLPSAVAPISSSLPAFVAVPNAPASAKMCGDNQKTLLDEWGLLVSNGRIVESGVQGEVCTTYEGVVTLDDGSAAAEFTADAHLVFDQATIDANKYYTNVALTKNVDKKLADISSIPASFTWSRTNTTDFRGNVCLDLVLGTQPHDWTSASTKEFQMWLYWQGNQQPLAWDKGVKSTFNLWGQSWDMYQGVNYFLADGKGVELTTIVPTGGDLGAAGTWSGDLKDWLLEMVKQGVVSEDYYVNVVNGGSETFWGDSVLKATVGLQINLK